MYVSYARKNQKFGEGPRRFLALNKLWLTRLRLPMRSRRKFLALSAACALLPASPPSAPASSPSNTTNRKLSLRFRQGGQQKKGQGNRGGGGRPEERSHKIFMSASIDRLHGSIVTRLNRTNGPRHIHFKGVGVDLTEPLDQQSRGATRYYWLLRHKDDRAKTYDFCNWKYVSTTTPRPTVPTYRQGSDGSKVSCATAKRVRNQGR